MVSTEQVWTSLRQDLGAFFRRRVNDEHLAEDLLQETFARVHDGLGTLDQEQRLAAWVWRVARNVLADQRRGRRAPEPLAEERPAGTEPADENLNREVSGWLAVMPWARTEADADSATVKRHVMDAPAAIVAVWVSVAGMLPGAPAAYTRSAQADPPA